MLIFINEHLFGDVGLSDGISIIFNKYDDQDRDKETIICLTLNIGCLSGKNISKHIVLRFKFPLIDSCSDSKKEKLQKDIDLIESIIKFMAVEIEKSLYLSIINNNLFFFYFFPDEIPIHKSNDYKQFIMGIQCVPLNKIIFNTLKVTKISAYGNFAKIKPA